MAIVHDLVPDIDRRPVFLERALDDLDRPFDPGTKPSGLRQHHSHHLASPYRRPRRDGVPPKSAVAYPCHNSRTARNAATLLHI